jgi:cytochrome P450
LTVGEQTGYSRLNSWRRKIRVGYERNFYRNQGIKFHGTVAPLGVERRVTSLLREGLTRDHLFATRLSGDFVATTRGFRVQLFAVSRAAAEAITAPGVAGSFVERDSPAVHSIGRLTPRALTFEPATVTGFRVRKQNLRRAVDTDIAHRFAVAATIPTHPAQDTAVDLRPLVIQWARSVMGDLMWGKEIGSEPIRYVDGKGRRESVEYRVGLHETFRRLRKYSTRSWLRVVPSASDLPVTAEARYLKRNIREIRAFAIASLPFVPDGHAARTLFDLNEHDEIEPEATLDDALTCYLAGVDTLVATIVASLWHILRPANSAWREALFAASGDGRARISEACVKEALRISPPGSLFNNRVTQDIEIDVEGKVYKLRSGTRITAHVHAVHAHSGSKFDPHPFLATGDAPYLLAFGRGARSCPGRPAGLALASIYLSGFLSANSTAMLAHPHENPAKFNTMSDQAFELLIK